MPGKNLVRLQCTHCGEATPHLVGHRDLPGGELSHHGICLRCDTVRPYDEADATPIDDDKEPSA